MKRKARKGEWLMDPSFKIGMVMDITNRNSQIWLQYVNNGEWEPWHRAVLRPATEAEVAAEGLSGTGAQEYRPDDDGKRVHILKTWPEFYEPAVIGVKPFEVRKDDRDFQLGDELILAEFIPGGTFTGRIHKRTIIYILKGGQFGIAAGYVVLGLR